MEKAVVDSDSNRSPSSEEKKIGHVGPQEHGILPDPDAHLSEAERAAIVRAAGREHNDMHLLWF